MSEQQTPKFHQYFHNFLIHFALWAYALVAVIQGFREIRYVQENGARSSWIVVVLAVLLMLVGVFTVKVRFDLAAFRPKAVAELLGVCLAAAVIVALIDLSLYWLQVTDVVGTRLGAAGILVLWGIALYRYYHDRPYLFKE